MGWIVHRGNLYSIFSNVVGGLVYKYSLKSSNLVDKHNNYWYHLPSWRRQLFLWRENLLITSPVQKNNSHARSIRTLNGRLVVSKCKGRRLEDARIVAGKMILWRHGPLWPSLAAALSALDHAGPWHHNIVSLATTRCDQPSFHEALTNLAIKKQHVTTVMWVDQTNATHKTTNGIYLLMHGPIYILYTQ